MLAYYLIALNIYIILHILSDIIAYYLMLASFRLDTRLLLENAITLASVSAPMPEGPRY